MITRPFVTIILYITLVVFLTITLWNVSAQSDQISNITSLAWDPDGNRVAAGDEGGAVGIWDVATGQFLSMLQKHEGGVTDVAWSPDGKKLASASLDQTVRIWDTNVGKLLNTLVGQNDAIYSVIWSQDGSKIISGSAEAANQLNLLMWDAATGQLLKSFPEGIVSGLLWSPDGTRLTIVNAGGYVGFRDAATLEGVSWPVLLIQPEATGARNSFAPVIEKAAWSRNGDRLATGSRNGMIRIWDLTTGHVLIEVYGNDNRDDKATASGMNKVSSLTFSADGNRLFSSVADGSLRAWDTATGKMLEKTQVNGARPAHVAAWSAFAGRLAVSDNVESGTAAQVQNPMSRVLRIIVPFPSIQELQAITKRCTKPDTQQSLTSRIDATKLPDFINAVKNLPRDKMPPSCAADLIAMAEALQKK